ncbi:hypothetical protein NLJ89_g285 [Agrocybe chaxingu]|uniref:Uncharacterized protein n=1 Tax=Agrocybe chaxingu TaxID=84603 RepID=A0A9W8TG80_9AGAR|nr:hypothetical protein NLJ89_g285 [Agrocybe chaxingu]
MSDPILTDPWRVIRDLHTACDPASTEQFPKFVTEHFKSHLQAPDAFAQVPILDLKHPPESFPNGSVVVFHAMIQDTSVSPELYLAKRENGVGGGWGLPDGDTDQTGDVRTSDLRECSVFWAVTIPGLKSKDEDLHSGWLQHPKGSVLLLTESAVTEGGIFNKGVMNIHSVQEMMRAQTLDYIFPFSSFQFDTDCSFVIVTEGKKSTFFKACTHLCRMLCFPPDKDIQTNVNVLLRPVLSVNRARQALYKSSDLINLPPPDRLSQFRRLIGGSKIGQVTIGESTGKHIEDDFVQERSTATNGAKGQGFTPDDLVQRMLVARQVRNTLLRSLITTVEQIGCAFFSRGGVDERQLGPR